MIWFSVSTTLERLCTDGLSKKKVENWEENDTNTETALNFHKFRARGRQKKFAG